MKKIVKKKNVNFQKSFQSLSLGRKILLFVFIGLIAATFLPAVIVLLIGMLPTLTIMFISPRNSAKLVTVGCFNLAGLFIYLVNILNSFTVSESFSLFGDIVNMLIMLCSAAFGFILYYEMPNLFAFIAKCNSQRRLVSIDNELKKISEEWGQDVIDQQINQIVK